MPFIPAENTVQAELLYTQDNQQLENVLYFSRADAIDVSEMTTLAAFLLNWWATEMQALTSNTVALRAVRLTNLTTETSPAIEVPPAAATIGSNANPAVPNSTTLAIKFTTAARGRSARGRNYVVGLTENTVIGNQVDAAHADALVAAYEEFLAGGSLPAGWFWTIVSRQFNKLPRVNALVQGVTGVSITDLIVDNQRRRLPGRGR